MMTSGSRRIAIRRYLRIGCSIVREHDFKVIAERTLDMSTNGMLVQTQSRVLTGEEVIVSFEIPSTRRWFDAEATVTRVVHGRRPGDTGRALGLTFHGVSNVQKATLAAILKRLPPPIPKRDPRAPQIAAFAFRA